MARKGSNVLTRLAVRMVLAVLIAGAAAAAFTLSLDDSYRARSLLILAPMPFEQEDRVPGNVRFLAAPTGRGSFMQVEMLKSLPMPDYKLLLTSEAMASKLRDALRERYTAKGIDPGNLTIEKVQRSLDVRLKVHRATPQEVQYQQVLELLLTATDPTVAAEVANLWTEESIVLAERMRAAAREDAVGFIEAYLDKVYADLHAANATVEALVSEWGPETMAARLKATEETVTEYRLRQSRGKAEAARAKAEIAELEKEIESMEPTLSLRKALPDEAYWLAKDGQAGKDGVLVTEEPNPAYAELLLRRSLLAGEVAGMRAEQVAITEELALLASGNQVLRKDLARVTRERSELDLKVETLEKTVREVGTSLQATKLAASDKLPEFKIAAKAVPPEEKSAPHRSLIVLVTVFLAALAVPVHFFGMVALRRYAGELEAQEGPGGEAAE